MYRYSAGRLAWCQDDNLFALPFALQCIDMLLTLGEELRAAEYIGMHSFIERLEHETAFAETRFRECLTIGEKYGDIRLMALAHSGLGSIAGDRGDYEGAHELKKKSLEFFRQLGDRYLVGLNSWSLAGNALLRGRINEAAALYRVMHRDRLGTRQLLDHSSSSRRRRQRFRVEGDPNLGLTLFAAASVLRERLGLAFAPLDSQIYQTSLSDFLQNLGEKN